MIVHPCLCIIIVVSTLLAYDYVCLIIEMYRKGIGYIAQFIRIVLY